MDAREVGWTEELDILRARIDDLAQLVTDYAAQHEQHTAALEQQATAWQAQQQQLSTQVGILTEQYAHITAGLQDARRLVGAGLTRIQQHIEHTRDFGPSPRGCSVPSINRIISAWRTENQSRARIDSR